MSDIVKRLNSGSDWRWSEGDIDERSEHFTLFHRASQHAVAIVGRPVGHNVPVKFTDTGVATRQAIEQELDFYITKLTEPDPWKYLKYHCGTASNLYAELRWVFTSPAQDIRSPDKVPNQNPSILGDCIQKLLKRRAVSRLIEINSARNDAGVISSPEFQRLFKGYYKVRNKKGEQFFKPYFGLLEHHVRSNTKPSLREVLLALYEKTGEKHLSFASKLLATLDDREPIYDRNVCLLLGIPHGRFKESKWLQEAEERIDLVKQRFADVISASSWPSHESTFDKAFPLAVHLSPQRKADLMIWASYADRGKI